MAPWTTRSTTKLRLLAAGLVAATPLALNRPGAGAGRAGGD
jgi:hypothetical protein